MPVREVGGFAMRSFRPLVLVFALLGCEPLPPADNRPPRLMDTLVSETGTELALDFDEPVVEATAGGNFAQAPATKVEGDRVKVALPPNLKPGKDYRWTAEVKDAGSNLTSVAGRFYGPNDHAAGLRLNEVRIAGSGTHTDMVELRVESSGSLGGWTVDAYASVESRQRLVLPDRQVSAGELVVVHYKPTGDPAEKDETASADASGGSDADPAAWDFWQPEGRGLSAVKGLVALRARPDSPPLDALLYSKAPGDGSPLAEAAGWKERDELSPDGCTATRTWSRTDDATPTWIVTANGGATPGKPNKLTPWGGPTSTRKTPTKSKGPGRRHRHRNPTKPPCPGSKPRPEGLEAAAFRRRSKDPGPERPSETPQGSPGHRGPARRASRPPIPRNRGEGGRQGRGPGRRRGDGLEGPPLRSDPSAGPPLPGTGRVGNPRREAPRPAV